MGERTAQIQIDNYIGQRFKLESGAPQGSCISPTLYSIFINDIPVSVYDHKHIYADDITQIIRYPGSSKEILKRRTTRAIEEVNKYEKERKIKTNMNKFQIIGVSKIKQLEINRDGAVINHSRTGMLLGITIATTGLSQFVNQTIQKGNTETKDSVNSNQKTSYTNPSYYHI